MATHVVPVKTYVNVFLALIVLTAVTTAVAFLDLGPFNNVVALGIAVTKATLVVLIFMGVRYATRMTPIVIASALFWLAIMIALTMSDYLSRGELLIPGK
jgi:cytochrome c oxidase subunit 4